LAAGRRWAGALLLLALLGSGFAVPARAGDTQTDFLPELNAYLKLTTTTRLFLLGSLTQPLSDGSTEGEAGVHLDLTLKPILRRELRRATWERERYLWVRFGYRLLGTLGYTDDPSMEHRGILEVTARLPLPAEIWLVNRGRVDLRDVDGDFSSRLRYRLGIERQFTVWDRALVPYAQAEIFFDTRYDGISRQRYQVGVEIELTAHWRIESYYRRHEDRQPSRKHENGIGLVLKYYH
jgi:hypothetical protein